MSPQTSALRSFGCTSWRLISKRQTVSGLAVDQSLVECVHQIKTLREATYPSCVAGDVSWGCLESGVDSKPRRRDLSIHLPVYSPPICLESIPSWRLEASSHLLIPRAKSSTTAPSESCPSEGSCGHAGRVQKAPPTCSSPSSGLTSYI